MYDTKRMTQRTAQRRNTGSMDYSASVPVLNLQRKMCAVFATAAFLFTVCNVSLHAQTTRIPWQAMNAGFGSWTDANLRTVGVLGQCISGRTADGNTIVTLGFLAGLRASYTGVVSVEDISDGTGGFDLAQNYPNPVLSSTTFAFTIPHPSHVTMEVFNTLGVKVKTLVNDVRTVGMHHIRWNPSELPDGVYIYKINAGSFTRMKKFLLHRE